MKKFISLVLCLTIMFSCFNSTSNASIIEVVKASYAYGSIGMEIVHEDIMYLTPREAELFAQSITIGSFNFFWMGVGSFMPKVGPFLGATGMIWLAVSDMKARWHNTIMDAKRLAEDTNKPFVKIKCASHNNSIFGSKYYTLFAEPYGFAPEPEHYSSLTVHEVDYYTFDTGIC